MRAINEKQVQKEMSPGRYNTDLYILSYAQNDINFIRNRNALSPTLPAKPTAVGQSPVLNSVRREGQQPTRNVADRWKHIDRLVEMLKRGSKSKEKDESACGRLFRLVQKAYARFWRLHSWQIKELAFKKIKAKSFASNPLPRLFNLKESLEMRENEIQKGSKNFELNDLMHIVDLHQNETTVNGQEKLRNSLSRQLILKEAEVRQKTPSPRKVSPNIYIIRRKTKDDLSTRQDLNSNTHISSEQYIPAGTHTARSISPHSVDRSKSPKSVRGDPHIDLAQTHSEEKENRLQELEIDSVKLDKSQELDQQECEGISNMKLPSFGINRPSQVVPTRNNRFMNPEMPQRKFIFHYKNSNEKSVSPRNEYFPPETTAKFILPRPTIAKNTGTLPSVTKVQGPLITHQNVTPRAEQPIRLQRISSLQALHPKSFISNQPLGGQYVQNNGQSTRREDQGSIQSRRCYSMPKITFTYKNRQEAFVNPSPPQKILKNSPIFVLNQLKSSNPNANMARQSCREDPYLSKNIQVTNIARTPCEIRPSSYISPKNIVYPANISAENYYNIPVNNYAVMNVVNHPPRPERFKIFSNHQTQPSNSFMPNQHVRRQDYYGAKQSVIPTQDTLPSSSRQRVRSTDTYILTKPTPNPQFAPTQQNIAYATVERERARSCGIKLEVVSRRQPMIRVC